MTDIMALRSKPCEQITTVGKGHLQLADLLTVGVKIYLNRLYLGTGVVQIYKGFVGPFRIGILLLRSVIPVRLVGSVKPVR